MKQLVISALCFLVAFNGFAQNNTASTDTILPLELSLKQAKEYAFENHPTVRSANLDVALAEATITERLAAGLPQVNGKAELGYYPRIPVVFFPSTQSDVLNLPNQNGENSSYLLTRFDPETMSPISGEPVEVSIVRPHSFSAGISASQLIFSASYIVGIKLAKLYSKLTEKQVQKTAIDTQYDIEQTYLTALIAGENIKLLQKTLPTIERSLFETTELNKNGFAEAVDVDRIKLSKANIDAQIKNLKEQQRLSIEFLRFQMGYTTFEPIILTDSVETFTDINFARLDSIAGISQRIEFDLLDMQEELSELQIKRFKSGYYPSLLGFADYSVNSQRDKFSKFKGSWFDSFLVGASLNVPIFDGRMKRAQIETSKLNLKKLDIAREQTTQGFIMEKKTAVSQYQTALIDKNNQEDNLALAQNIYDTALIKYKEGLGSSLEVNSAEGTFLQTQANYINSLYSLVLAKARINNAYGIY